MRLARLLDLAAVAFRRWRERDYAGVRRATIQELARERERHVLGMRGGPPWRA